MGFKPLIIGAFVIAFLGCVGSTLHYKKQAETTALLLNEVKAEKNRQDEMLVRYQAQTKQLNSRLNKLEETAEHRRQQLKDMLSHEQNKIWSNQHVPDDVAGLLNNRTTN